MARLERAARQNPDGVDAKPQANADALAARIDAVIGRIDRVLEG